MPAVAMTGDKIANTKLTGNFTGCHKIYEKWRAISGVAAGLPPHAARYYGIAILLTAMVAPFMTPVILTSSPAYFCKEGSTSLALEIS